MANDQKRVQRHMGPGPIAAEKPKDLKNAVSKLMHYLKSYMPFIVIALILACVSSILSIVGPNQISKLTDKISEGLVVNQYNLKQLSSSIEEDVNKDSLTTLTSKIMTFDLSSENITKILTSSTTSVEDKKLLQSFISNVSNLTNEQRMMSLMTFPDPLTRLILTPNEYNGINISVDDKMNYMSLISSISGNMNQEEMMTKFNSVPDSIKLVLFSDTEINGINVSANDKLAFLNTMSSIDTNSTTSLYNALDELPDNVRDIIKPTMDMSGIKYIAIVLLSLYLISALFNYIENLIMVIVSNNFAKELRTKISIKINKLSLRYFDTHSYGDILSRVTNDVDTINMSMHQSLGTLVSSITLFIGAIIMMFKTNYIMAITGILSSLVGFVLMFIILGKSQKYFTARQVELGKLNGHIEEIYSSHNVVKAYNGEEASSSNFDKLNDSVYECNRKSQFLSGLMQPIMAFIGNFSYVAVCIVGAVLVVNNQISFGVIVAFIIYVRLFTSPLSQIAQGMTQLQTTAAASERVFEFVEEKEMNDQKKITGKLEKSTVKGNIEFDHVKFGYNPDKVIIKDFSCKVKPGEKIAIVGPTGAGKTTIVNLLMKFYETNKGNIIIDGVPISNLTRENIHDLFIMVLQDTWLFNGTIRDNIKFNKENVSDEEIWKALDTVGVDHFVKSLPHTLDYKMGDNESISAGQKQLLTIARGMIEDAPFLILDEATSSVDTRTEELVQKAMDKLTEGRTSFIIAHRLSTIKNADLILVMRDGNIVEQGNHDELIKQNGFYADLYNSQFQN